MRWPFLQRSGSKEKQKIFSSCFKTNDECVAWARGIIQAKTGTSVEIADIQAGPGIVAEWTVDGERWSLLIGNGAR